MRIRITARHLIARILSLVPTKLTGISVLMYHSVDTSGAFFSVTPHSFEKQMRYIKERHFRMVFASEVPALVEKSDIINTVCVTFDDGYENNYSEAFEILKKYGIRATVFLITGSIGKTFTNSEGKAFPMLSQDQMKEMYDSGLIEFMPHTHTHPDFDSLSSDQMRKELLTARSIIEELVNVDGVPPVFAYPRGKYSKEAIVTVRDCGFIGAFSVRCGLITGGEDVYTLPRNAVDSATNSNMFALLTSNTLLRYITIKNLFIRRQKHDL